MPMKLTPGRSLIAVAICATLAALTYALVKERSVSAAGGNIADGKAACCIRKTADENLTLNPELFKGPVQEAYRVARDNPELLSQLHCYCGCDKEYGHKSLLDCFRDQHGSKCAIGVGEAVEANQLAHQGKPVEQIRDALRARFDRGG